MENQYYICVENKEKTGCMASRGITEEEAKEMLPQLNSDEYIYIEMYEPDEFWETQEKVSVVHRD